MAFCASVSLFGHKRRRRISRIVTLPDYQGIGIGMKVAETVAELHRGEGCRVNLTASHPAVMAHCRRSPRWRAVRGAEDRLRGPGRLPRLGRPGRGVVRVRGRGPHESQCRSFKPSGKPDGVSNDC